MVDPRASRFWQAALQSGLIDAEGLQACFDAIAPEKRVADHLDRRLARRVVQQGRLTLWQAQQLLAGRSSGFKINRYMLIDMIGQGGMGRVYLARDTRLNRRVALKILSPERMDNPRAIKRFQREALVGAQLQHENLVRIYDEGEANGRCYLVMEYIEGKNIGAIIAEDGPIPPATAARLARQIALGLEHAQQKGLIHRDVNPYNILVTREGIAKLTDLGLALDLMSEEAQVTREGATVGTFDYVSPEQARHSHSVDTRSDIYSLGCTLYHMLSGQVPFASPSLPEKLFAHQAVDPVPLSDLVPSIPVGLSQVVQKMMRKLPDERYPTPLDVAVALDPYTDNPGNALYAGHVPPGVRGVGRASRTETQVVDAPLTEPGSVAALAATQASPRVLDQPPSSPSSSSGTRPSLAPAPAPVEASGPPQGPGGAVEGSTPRSNEDWSDLGLSIDLGPEPSLTEGLAQSRKKKPRSSPELLDETLPANVPILVPPPPLPVSPPVEAAQPAPDWAVVTSPPAPATDGLARLGLSLDLGPEPPLSSSTQSRARSKARPVVPPPLPSATNSHSTRRPTGRRPGRRWLIGVGAIGAGAAVAGIIFGFSLLGQARPNGTGRARSSSSAPGVAGTSKADPEDRPPEGVARRDDAPEVPAGQSFAVKTRDGKVFSETSLKSAMQRAIRSKGHVLLNNRKPLMLTGPDRSINISGGHLYIRAAQGVQPVLEIELKGSRPSPFLVTRTETPLTMEGVSIVARYAGMPGVVPPLIEAGGNLTLKRCAFTATGAVKVKGSRAVASEGGSLIVQGCWFDGFDTPLDVAAFAGSATTIKQSMMVQARTDDRPIGWAIRIRRTAGGSSPVARRLLMEHCTVKGGGLLHLVDFSPESPLNVEIKDCATRTDAVLAWETPKPGTPLTAEALTWNGDGNQYDIPHGKAWVVLSSEGTPELPDGPTDLASWRSKMGERHPLPPPIRFRVPPESLSEAPQPADFGLADQDARSHGADPSRVGPSAPPER